MQDCCVESSDKANRLLKKAYQQAQDINGSTSTIWPFGGKKSIAAITTTGLKTGKSSNWFAWLSKKRKDWYEEPRWFTEKFYKLRYDNKICLIVKSKTVTNVVSGTSEFLPSDLPVIYFHAFHRINWKIDSRGSVEINNNHEGAHFDVNENLPTSLLINGFFGMKFFYGSSALRASDPPKNFIPQKPFISNLEGKFPFTSKGSLMINIFFLPIDK